MADTLGFNWDDANVAHLGRHHITRAEAEQVFHNGYVCLDEQNINGEQRSLAVGFTDAGRCLTILWTERGKLVRPITGWDAEMYEQQCYWAERGDL